MGIVQYRQGICAVIQNTRGDFLLCQKKTNPLDWKFPSGGIENGETEEAALFREMNEELGTNSFNIIKKSDRTIRYRWPSGQPYEGLGFIGQEQRHFLLRFTGSNDDIKLDQKEFEVFEWMKREEVLRRVTPQRKETYRKAFRYFK